MTWTISISGHDDLDEQYKTKQEQGIVDKARAFVADLAANEGIIISSANVTTNTTGTQDVKPASFERQPGS